MNGTQIAGLIIILLFTCLVAGIWIATRARPYRGLRPIPGYGQLRRAINLAVEDGSRVHVTLGSASILSPQNASALVGLTVLDRITQLGSASDRPPVATSGDGSLAILSQDTLRATYRTAGASQNYDPTLGRVTGLTPFSYAAGTIPVMKDPQVTASVMMGDFGPEAGLIADAAEQSGSFLLAASNSLTAQAVLYAAAREPLLGEELFAGGAYLQAGAAHAASLRAQDVARWLIAVALLVGAILKLAGIV